MKQGQHPRQSMALREDRQAMEVTQALMAERPAEVFRTVERVMIKPSLVRVAAVPADFYLFMIAGWWRKRFDFAAETRALPPNCRA